MSRRVSGTAADPHASAPPRSSKGRIWLILGLAALGVATYAASLAASLPARLLARQADLPDQIVDVSGTIWNGQAIVAGGYQANWTVAPWQSLLHVAFDVDWTLSGADTLLEGHASLWPRSAGLSAIEGRAGWGLVRIFAPDLAVSCQGSAAVSLARVELSEAFQGAQGSLRSGDAACLDATRTPPEPIEVPPLSATATIEGKRSQMLVTGAADPDALIAAFAIEARTLFVTIYPAGMQLARLPAASGPVALEFPF